jgi:hypothetical protein
MLRWKLGNSMPVMDGITKKGLAIAVVFPCPMNLQQRSALPSVSATCNLLVRDHHVVARQAIEYARGFQHADASPVEVQTTSVYMITR